MLCYLHCNQSREQRQTDKWYLRSGVGDYFLSIFVPCDERAGEGSQSRLADDSCSALRHRLPLLLSRKVPLNLRRGKKRHNKRGLINYICLERIHQVQVFYGALLKTTLAVSVYKYNQDLSVSLSEKLFGRVKSSRVQFRAAKQNWSLGVGKIRMYFTVSLTYCSYFS